MAERIRIFFNAVDFLSPIVSYAEYSKTMQIHTDSQKAWSSNWSMIIPIRFQQLLHDHQSVSVKFEQHFSRLKILNKKSSINNNGYF